MEKRIYEAAKYHFNEASFENLMRNRIYKVLIICSNYHFYMLGEDERIDEQIFQEYVSLNLSRPPVFIHASTEKQVYELLENEDIDLVINMVNFGEINALELARNIKMIFRTIPVVILTPFSSEITSRLRSLDLGGIDYVFYWLGNADILLAIIKLIEDMMNVEHDALHVGVQTILLVEDSIRFYSSYLPLMYKIVLKQSRFFMTEGLNRYREMLQMRGRPKILLATNYDEASNLYLKYKDNMLGIISDTRYRNKGVFDLEAGIKLLNLVRSYDSFVPFLLQSSAISNKSKADELKVGFLHKNSKTMTLELRDFIFNNLSFGAFIFKDPDTQQEIGRASNLQEIHKMLEIISEESLRCHFARNDLSRWLNARAIFPLASILKSIKVEDFPSFKDSLNFLIKAIASYRINMGRGVIANFDHHKHDEFLTLTRIGDGSLGGKARGLAFIDSFLKNHRLVTKFDNVLITIPKTVVLCSDVFDDFMEDNHLYEIALSNKTDQEILDCFVDSLLPQSIIDDLKVIISLMHKPLAIRSSSKLEDSHYQPFAGIYSTYMIPNPVDNQEITLQNLQIAIKSVYASVFYKSSKAYIEATKNVIDEEKMSIVIQELCGSEINNIFYPTISGTARSVNFYPIPPEKHEDGIAKVALGLGKLIVGGGAALSFSPMFPHKILQLSSPEHALRETQKFFYALDLNPLSFKPSLDDDINLKKLPVKDALCHPSFKFVASTFDYDNNMIKPGINYEGKKIITFDNILQYNTFPLSQLLNELLKTGQDELSNPVEIEFAANLDSKEGYPYLFNVLQIRPVVEITDYQVVDVLKINNDNTIIISNSALGNGIIKDVKDIIFIKPENFQASNNQSIVTVVEKLNEKLVSLHRGYVLVGPGRWGSQDPWLGIPVKWSQISGVKLIVESGIDGYRIEPSQGTHFFQNLTSFRVGYFTINPFMNDGFYNLEYLNTLPANYEDNYLKHIEFKKELLIKIDGKRNTGVLYKPLALCNQESDIKEAGKLLAPE